MEQIIQTLQDGAITIVCLLISIGVVYAVIYLTKFKEKLIAQTEGIKDENQRKLLTNAIEDMHRILVSSVVRVDAQLKPELVNAIKDGKIDKSELGKLSDVVVGDVLGQLQADSIKALNDNIGDVEKYIQGELEKTLADLKAQGTLPTLDLDKNVSREEYDNALALIEELKKEIEDNKNK